MEWSHGEMTAADRAAAQRIVQERFKQIKAFLGASPRQQSLDRLALLVAACRQKPNRFDRRPLCGNYSGLTIALSDVDLIRTCQDLDDFVEEYARCHELMHLLGKDLPHVSLPLTYNAFLRIPEDVLPQLYREPVVICRSKGPNEAIVSAFTTPREYIAERLTTEVMGHIERYRSFGYWHKSDIY